MSDKLSHEDFLDWLACSVFENDWEYNQSFYREIILRKLVRMGYVGYDSDSNYILKNATNNETKTPNKYHGMLKIMFNRCRAQTVVFGSDLCRMCCLRNECAELTDDT